MQEKIIFKDQMMCLKNVGTDEVQCLAEKVTKKIKYDKVEITDKIIKFIMNIKINDINKEIDEEKPSIKKIQDALDDIVRPKTIVAHAYRSCVKKELEDNWKHQKWKTKQRINHLKTKNERRFKKKTLVKVPETYKGVAISDKLLGETSIPQKVKIHEDVDLNNEQIKALDVLPKDTFHSNITIKDADNQTEACFAKMRWGDQAKSNDDNDEPKKVYDNK